MIWADKTSRKLHTWNPLRKRKGKVLILPSETSPFIVLLLYENTEYSINNTSFISELINTVLTKKVYKNFLNVHMPKNTSTTVHQQHSLTMGWNQK